MLATLFLFFWWQKDNRKWMETNWNLQIKSFTKVSKSLSRFSYRSHPPFPSPPSSLLSLPIPSRFRIKITYLCNILSMKLEISWKSTTPVLTSKWKSFLQDVLFCAKSNVNAPVVSNGMFQNRTIRATAAGKNKNKKTQLQFFFF